MITREVHDILLQHLDTWTPTAEQTIVERMRYLALALTNEAGEFAGVVKKEWRGDYRGTDTDWWNMARDELADVLNYAVMLAIVMGVDISRIMMAKLVLAENRYDQREAREKLREWLEHHKAPSVGGAAK